MTRCFVLAAARSDSSACLPKATGCPLLPRRRRDTGLLWPQTLLSQQMLAVLRSQPSSPSPHGHPRLTWHPRAARRKPRTVGEAGAAPVTIMRTHPPRLACSNTRKGNQKYIINQDRWQKPGVFLMQSLHKMAPRLLPLEQIQPCCGNVN